MRATHHLHPNVRFLQLRSSDEKSTVRSDRKSLIKLKANRMVRAYRTKSVCENPYNTRYLLVL